jgi:predicted nucleotidyltransferase
MDPDVLRLHLAHLFHQHPVLLAYLFGSQTTGQTHAESDIDVAVLLHASLTADERFAERLTLIDALARLLGTDNIDVVILNEAPPLLAYEALRNGVLLYCADENARVEFQVRTLRTYEDTAPLRQMLSEAMAERIKAGAFGKPVLISRR